MPYSSLARRASPAPFSDGGGGLEAVPRPGPLAGRTWPRAPDPKAAPFLGQMPGLIPPLGLELRGSGLQSKAGQKDGLAWVNLRNTPAPSSEAEGRWGWHGQLPRRSCPVCSPWGCWPTPGGWPSAAPFLGLGCGVRLPAAPAPPNPGKGALGVQHGGSGSQPPCAPGSLRGVETEWDRGLLHMRGSGPFPDLRSQKTMPDSCAVKITFNEPCCSSPLSHGQRVLRIVLRRGV